MFTGIIDHKAKLLKTQPLLHGQQITLQTRFSAVGDGESISVAGACLTVTGASADGELSFDLSPETLERTTLSNLTPGEHINVERALRAGDRMGGHAVSGHIDCTAVVQEVQSVGDFTCLQISGYPEPYHRFLSEKGWIAVNGVSLTVNRVLPPRERATGSAFECMLVPQTLHITTLADLRAGTAVNLEFDATAKLLVERVEAWLRENYANK